MPADVTTAAQQLKARLTEHGDLRLNTDKEEVLWAGQDLPAQLREYVSRHGCRLVLTGQTNVQVQAVAASLGSNVTVTNETTVLGVPIGHRAAERAIARMTRNSALFAALHNEMLSMQNAFLLLRLVCNSFGTYLARTMHPNDSRAAMEHLDTIVHDVLQRRLELAPAELERQPSALQQVHLKLSQGGLGFQRAHRTRFVAFWAAAAQAAPLLAEDALHRALDDASWLQSGLETCWSSQPFETLRTTDAATILPPSAALRDFITFYRSQVTPRRQRRRTPGQDLDPADAAAADQERVPAEKLQRALSTKLASHDLHEFKTGLPPEGLTRLQSLTGPGAVFWLTTCPTEEIRTFQNLDFSSLVRLRLGLSPLPAGPDRCLCPASPLLVDAPSHTLSCQHLRTTATEQAITSRHDLVKNHLASLLRQAGLHVLVEPQNQDERTRSRPDLSVYDMRGRTFLMDTTVVNTTADSAGPNAALTEERSAKLKSDKYASMAAAQNATFVPLVFSVYGHWHERVDQLLAFTDHNVPRAAPNALLQNTQLTPPLWRTQAATVLSCALQRGNANIMQIAIQHLRAALSSRGAPRGHAGHAPFSQPVSVSLPAILSVVPAG